MRTFKRTSNNSIFSLPATRWPLFHKDSSWPKAIFSGALKILIVITLLLLIGTSVACGHKALPQPPESMIGK
jgi:hypothetical protein